jgi:hypothetical protein
MRKGMENARSPADLRGCQIFGADQFRRAERVILWCREPAPEKPRQLRAYPLSRFAMLRLGAGLAGSAGPLDFIVIGPPAVSGVTGLWRGI